MIVALRPPAGLITKIGWSRAVYEFINHCRVLFEETILRAANSIAGFHCYTIIKTIQQMKSRIKEIKEDEYSNSLARIQVCAMFRAGDIRRNVFLKFIMLCMETPCFWPSEGHKYGGRKLTKTYVIEFARKSL